MKKITTSILVILSFVSINFIYSQDLKPPVKNKPFIEINVNSSYNYALFDLNGNGGLKGFWSFQDYSVGSGLGTNAEIKIGLFTTKMAQLKIHMMMGYSHFSNEDSKAYTIGSVDNGWPYTTLPNSNLTFLPKDTTGTSYLRFNMPSIAFGLECAVYTDRENKSSFNFGLDYLATIITGRAYEKIGNAKESYVTINPSLRFGVGINIAYSYRFADWVGFNVGTRFAMPNLLGKSSEMTDQAGYISLLDDSNIALNSNLSTKRTMGFFQLFGGVCFYLSKM